MEKNLKDAEQFLDTYLGGNRNVSTLTWNHWIECLRDYSDYQARQQPVKNPMLEKLRFEISTSDKQEIDEYVKAVDGQQPVRKTLDECKDEVARGYGYKDWNELYNCNDASNNVIKEVAELYAQSTKAVEPQQEIATSQPMYFDNDDPLYRNANGFIHRAVKEIGWKGFVFQVLRYQKEVVKSNYQLLKSWK